LLDIGMLVAIVHKVGILESGEFVTRIVYIMVCCPCSVHKRGSGERARRGANIGYTTAGFIMARQHKFKKASSDNAASAGWHPGAGMLAPQHQCARPGHTRASRHVHQVLHRVHRQSSPRAGIRVLVVQVVHVLVPAVVLRTTFPC
jgi:hypothetical protein